MRKWDRLLAEYREITRENIAEYREITRENALRFERAMRSLASEIREEVRAQREESREFFEEARAHRLESREYFKALHAQSEREDRRVDELIEEFRAQRQTLLHILDRLSNGGASPAT